MITTIVFIAGGVVGVLGGLVIYAAWRGLLDEDNKVRRDEKHRNHHKWGHYKGRGQ